MCIYLGGDGGGESARERESVRARERERARARERARQRARARDREEGGGGCLKGADGKILGKGITYKHVAGMTHVGMVDGGDTRS